MTRRAWNGNQRRPRVESNQRDGLNVSQLYRQPFRLQIWQVCLAEQKAGDTPATTEPAPRPYGDFFGEAEVDAAAGDIAGGVAAASAGFALSNSTSKISVAFGPMSPPAPLGP